MGLKVIFTLVYGLIIVTGGIIGYVTARSVPSLVSGGLLGLIVLVGGILLASGRTWGGILSLTATLLVALFFGFQLIKGLSTGGPVGRAALILGLSIIEILILTIARAPVEDV